MMRDNAIFRHTIQDRGHPERMRSAPRGGTAAEGADIPPGNSAGPDLHQARKIGAAWADPGCALVPLSCLVFPFRGGSLGPLFSPVSSVSGLTFRGPLLFGWGLHLGTRPPGSSGS